jgi:hypothetical protein
MESLRGIFPTSQPPPKRDFLKENVLRIRNMQRMRKPKDATEYSNKFSKPSKPPRKFSLCDSKGLASHSSNNLALCSTKAPISNLRKSVSTFSVSQHSREFGTQTVDPESDEYFLKDTIIRYPSASTVRSMSNLQQIQPHTCSRGHLLEDEPSKPRYKSHFHNRSDDHCEKMERHISNLSEFLEKGSISKKPASILKTSSATGSTQKLNKNAVNETQQKEDRTKRVGSGHRRREEMAVQISDEDNESYDEKADNRKEYESEKKSERGGGSGDISSAKKKQLKAAAEDPDCPEGHVPLSDDERQESLKIAKKRKL